ncbi:MAG: AraC family transcriptional regulator [Clostridiaceae bacterium]|nr:AraC family transcriptional regulator [Clostridiaceae bacterium]
MQDLLSNNDDQPFSISYAKQRAPFSMPHNHIHDFYEMYYLLSGERNYFIKNRTYRLTKGSLVCIPPLELHRSLDADIDQWERILIYFRPSFLASADPGRIECLTRPFFQESLLVRFPPKEQVLIEDILGSMLHEADSLENGYPEMLAAQLIRLLVLTLRCGSQPIGPDEHPVQEKFNRAAPIIHYINNHYQEPLTLPHLASHFHMSPFYLCKIFRASTGFTIIEYLNQVRIKEAQSQLRQSRGSVLDIAGAVGFGSISHFGRVFKENTGVSPLVYRKRYR